MKELNRQKGTWKFTCPFCEKPHKSAKEALEHRKEHKQEFAKIQYLAGD